MRNFIKIADGVDVAPLLLALQRHPELWGRHDPRKTAPASPHGQMDDIWLRYRDYKDFDPKNREAFVSEHFPVWYPAFHSLPETRKIIFWLMARIEAVHLGGVLITRIPPKGKIEPHIDRGWHPEFYNVKLYVVLQSNPFCVSRVENEYVAMEPGSVWFFDNLKEHEVINNGDDERITLIICMRCE